MSVINFNFPYVPDPNKGEPLAFCQLYIGEPDLDPEIPVNQKAINIKQEDGTLVPVTQPFVFSAGGVPIYEGSTARLDVDGNYSLKILSSSGEQKYYVHNVFEGEPVTEESLNTILQQKNYLGIKTLSGAVADLTAYDGAYVKISDRGFGLFKYEAGLTPNGYNIITADATNLDLSLEIGSELNPLEWGLYNDNTNPTANNGVLEALRDYIISQPTGSQPSIKLPKGKIAYSVSPNWGHHGITIKGDGANQCQLIYSGSGSALNVDPSEYDIGFRYGLHLEGFLIDCGASGTSAIYMENIAHSLIKNVYAINGGVTCNHFDFRLIVLVHIDTCGTPISRFTPTSIHQESIRLGSSPSKGLPSTGNTITNFIAEGASLAGMRLLDCTNNTFIGGTSESNSGRGVLVSPTSRNNSFIGTDIEANTLADIRDEGQSTHFKNCLCVSESGVQIAAGSQNSKIEGGMYGDITVEATATGAVIKDLQYNFNTGETITDSATGTTIENVVDRQTGNIVYFHKLRQNVPVTASPMLFTNDTGRDVQLLIKGGVVTQLLWRRGADSTPIGLPADNTPVNGLFTLKPEDSITISYGTAPTSVNYIPM